VAALRERVARLEARLGEARGFHSRFGGLWPDRRDAQHRIASMTGERGRLFRQWSERGFVVLEGAVPAVAIDAANAEIEGIYETSQPVIHAEWYEGADYHFAPVEARHRDMNVKVHDLYAHFESVRRVAFAEAVVAFLRELFDEDALAFQSLSFRFGSEQPMHQDTAYVAVEDPLRFVGVWIALEDIAPGSGELLYYPGSHRFDDFLWDGEHKRMPQGHADHERYLESLHRQAALRGIEATRLLPRKGDAMVWHAELAHGGAPRRDPSLTRRSLVTHFCPLSTDPGYFRRQPHSERLRHESGAWYGFAKR